jgi:hypothetical protein
MCGMLLLPSASEAAHYSWRLLGILQSSLDPVLREDLCELESKSYVCLIVVIPGDSTLEHLGGMKNISEFLTFYYICQIWVNRN